MRLVFDFEATGSQRNKAHPFDKRNRACNVGIKNIDTGEAKIFKLEYDEEPYGEALSEIKALIEKATLLIGFNVKYDLHWLNRYGINYDGFVFDAQLAYYILTCQKNKYPSLNEVALFCGSPVKLDVVKEEYWDKGLDTDEVPYDILCEYLAQDLETTESVFYKLSEMLANSSYEMQKLVKMSNLDLTVLQDIERNGLLVDIDKCIKEGDSIAKELEIIDSKFKTMAGHEWFNTNSGEHLSALLYGGVITHVEKVPYTFHYKDGRTAEKLRNQEVEYTFKGFFKPLEGSELEKEGFYSTGQPTLVALAEKAKEPYKSILNLLLHRAKIEKRRSTYYHGYPKNIDMYGWTDNILHTSYNQCVAETGRLSSTKPNVQNIEDKVKEVFITRFR